MALKSFPRGGKKPEVKKFSNMLFDEKHNPKRNHKTQTKKKNDSISLEKTNLIATTAERLSYATLHEGMTILGRVSEVSECDLIVSIPGGLRGCIEAVDISDAYTILLQDLIKTMQSNHEFKPLLELYSPGDYVVCYVKCLNLEGKWLCNLSLKPQLINQNIHSSHLMKDMKIICTIKSIEDHGYVVDTGLANVRAFLATENVDKGKQYFLGHQLLCVIKEIEVIDYICVIQVSTNKKRINNVSTHDIVSIDALTPGTKLSLCVTKVLFNGLQVTFGNDNVGYINQVYLNNPLSTYAQDMTVTGLLLYVLPTVKLAYFSLLTNISEKEKLNVGDIEKAKFLYRESNGIMLKLSNSGLRGFVSFVRSGVPFAEIPTLLKKDSLHTCRILAYNWMEHLYVCSMQRDLLEVEYFSPSDLNHGDIVTVTVTGISTKSSAVYVRADKIYASVHRAHISDDGPSAIKKLKIGDKIKARVWFIFSSYVRPRVQFTLKQSLINSKLPILDDISKAQCGQKYHGLITKIDRKGLLVRFYGMLKGWIPCASLDSNTCDMNWNYTIGQTVTVCIDSVDKVKNKMKLKLVTEEQKQESISFSIGEVVKGTITESSIKGVFLRIHKEEDDGNVITSFLPASHMAPCIEIGNLLASRYTPGDTISAFVFATKPAMILSRTFVTQQQYRSFNSLKVGDCIPCTIRYILQDGVRVILPIDDYSKFGFVSYKNISNFELLHVNQMLFVKITAIDTREKQLTLTMALKDVWESDSHEYKIKIMTAVDILNLYFNKLSELASNTFYENKPISSVCLGQKVTGTVEKITEHGLVLQLDDRLVGTVRKDHYSGNFQVGDKVSGTVLWKNYVHELVDVSLLPKIVNGISSKQKMLPELPIGITLRGEILMITKWLILVLIKRNGSGYLAALPARRHANDISPDLTPYVIHAKIRLYVVIKRSESNIVPICMLKSAFETPKASVITERTIKKNSKKRKLSKRCNVDLPNLPIKASKIENKQNKIAIEKEKEDRIKDIDENSESGKDTSDESEIEEDKSGARKLHIPECGFSWDDKASSTAAVKTETSSDDEQELEEEPKRKKKKLSAAERREQERQKEREIRQREEALASNQIPNSIDQFDRLVLSSPDSSLVWLQYMAYHLQATEIDKARTVARRAIKTINFREESERLNVWNAWLNLESRFGNPESLNDVFREAVRTNDAFEVYTHMLTVHVDAGRTAELEKLIGVMIGKFKQNPQTWVDCGAAFLKVGMKEKSRHIMQRALQSLPTSQHVNLLVKFANLENKLGDKERAQTLFENILSSYPKRVDVWSCYVDCLIKSENIDLARRVLERACVQTLPARKMKTLFTKFISFEEKYGTSEAVAHVRQMAADYVKKQCNKE